MKSSAQPDRKHSSDEGRVPVERGSVEKRIEKVVKSVVTAELVNARIDSRVQVHQQILDVALEEQSSEIVELKCRYEKLERRFESLKKDHKSSVKSLKAEIQNLKRQNIRPARTVADNVLSCIAVLISGTLGVVSLYFATQFEGVAQVGAILVALVVSAPAAVKTTRLIEILKMLRDESDKPQSKA